MYSSFEAYDLVIIGGGINGAANFLTACLNGLKTLLIEKDVIGGNSDSKAATFASLGLVQGGLQYVKSDLNLVRMDSIDAGLLSSITVDLLKNQDLIVPVFEDYSFPFYSTILWQSYLNAYDDFAKFKLCPKHKTISRQELYALEPKLRSGAKAGVIYSERIVEPSELVKIFVKAGKYFGGQVLETTKLVSFTRSNDLLTGAFLLSKNGETKTISADYFLNTTGAWAPGIVGMFESENSDFRLRPTRGTSLVFNQRLSNNALIVFNQNQKYISILPQGDSTLVGPTNYDISDRVYHNPDLLEPQEYETRELFWVIKKYLNLDIEKLDYQFIKKCGLRPQLYDSCKKPDDVTHEFAIFDHENQGVINCATLAGGKLSNSLRMAKETIELVCTKLNKRFNWEIPFLSLSKNRKPLFMNRPVYPFLNEYDISYALGRNSDIKSLSFRNRLSAKLNLAHHTIKYCFGRSG